MFKVGDKVRCIDAYNSFELLTKNKEYTVTLKRISLLGIPMIGINDKNVWYAKRFEPIKQTEEDLLEGFCF